VSIFLHEHAPYSYLFRSDWEAVKHALADLSTAYPPPHGLHKLLVKGNQKVHLAANAIGRVEQSIIEIESQLGLECRWSSATPEYVAIVQDMSKRNYRLALDNLEQLVVQWLFELSKLNMSGTGIICSLLSHKLKSHTCGRLQTLYENRQGPSDAGLKPFAKLSRSTTLRLASYRHHDLNYPGRR